jgi:hypothetical protein
VTLFVTLSLVFSYLNCRRVNGTKMTVHRGTHATPSDLPNTIPAIKKRLYQFMVEIAVINDRIRSDVAIHSAHVEDAAALADRLSKLENVPADD